MTRGRISTLSAAVRRPVNSSHSATSRSMTFATVTAVGGGAAAGPWLHAATRIASQAALAFLKRRGGRRDVHPDRFGHMLLPSFWIGGRTRIRVQQQASTGTPASVTSWVRGAASPGHGFPQQIDEAARIAGREGGDHVQLARHAGVDIPVGMCATEIRLGPTRGHRYEAYPLAR